MRILQSLQSTATALMGGVATAADHCLLVFKLLLAFGAQTADHLVLFGIST